MMEHIPVAKSVSAITICMSAESPFDGSIAIGSMPATAYPIPYQIGHFQENDRAARRQGFAHR